LTLSDYIHVMKPRIIPLLVLVAFGSSVIAARSLPSPSVLLGVVGGGSLASAGALALNSYLEMGIDAKMRRTSKRPLPSGKIEPPSHALVFGLSLVASGILLAFLTVNYAATLFIALGAFVYVPVYTLWLKPRTTWNIVLGGFAGSCAALAGWYAVTFSQPLVGWLLAALVFVWTPSHFWSLAVITEEDYSSVGIPMLPSVVGPESASRYIVANTLILIPVSLMLLPFMDGYGYAIYAVFVAAIDALLLATNLKLLRAPTKENAWLAFKFSSPYLALVFVVAMVASVI
jgi:protoheme IX farnesyltransferase